MSTTPMVVQTVPISSLVEDPYNARVHGEENLKAIRDSLSSHGQVEPLVVQQSTMRVLGGNGRLQAMKVLGWTDAAVVLVDLPDSRARALGLALNRTAEMSEWNFATLADTLQEIDTGEFDLPALTGFDDEELKRIAEWVPKDGFEFSQIRKNCPTCGSILGDETA
jgi:ParB-like chromosome segregation protein Spo0J